MSINLSNPSYILVIVNRIFCDKESQRVNSTLILLLSIYLYLLFQETNCSTKVGIVSDGIGRNIPHGTPCSFIRAHLGYVKV